MNEYRLYPVETRWEGTRWDVQVVSASGRHVAFHEFQTKEAAEQWIANRAGGAAA